MHLLQNYRYFMEQSLLETLSVDRQKQGKDKYVLGTQQTCYNYYLYFGAMPRNLI